MLNRDNEGELREKLAEVLVLIKKHGSRSEEVRQYIQRSEVDLGDKGKEFVELAAVVILGAEGKWKL